MRFTNICSTVLPILTTLTTASPSPSSYSTSKIPPRPNLTPSPYTTGLEFPCSPPRSAHKKCFVAPVSTSADRDDAPAIKAALKKCNNGGTVVLDKSYLVSSPLDLTFLRHVDVVITGEIHFNAKDVYYWAENSFKYDFQNMSTFWKWGGEDVNIYGDLSNGKSVIDGHGQKYWEEIVTNKTLFRPILFSMDGMKGATMSNLRMRNSPNWFNIIANSSDILISDLDIQAKSTDGVKIANSDGWDTYRSNNVVIQNSVIDNTDDCVSFKPNSTNVIVQNLDCTGSHGISVGSLGQYANLTDIVSNLYIHNITMALASDFVRIKVWPGVASLFQENLNGGGGKGYVRNVTYEGLVSRDNDRAITITQCYGQKNQTLCNEFPSELRIEDVLVKNLRGTTSKKADPEAGTLVCSAPDRCSNIRVEDVDIKVPSGNTTTWECMNVDESLLKINCVASDGERDTTNG
ncbi:glycoside hydrolase family 28 protein [Aaosphaeria arxii CBS 175.79]|uniref:galacturonan 1,4-alpha-galacturonidase n=1 Tax=Aaosphaeria arxii CBS 175.79 TaxID=1450172 RepID=A0A6A5Y3M4_9PLEO|nr:glycoside hydrolase family 28 protein [Aaosphaeria arxii CBS 175.79]KAF2020142.1 glycoside hydrolase family 28 protein [Aaosphaeria arxii CBS 175.79]